MGVGWGGIGVCCVQQIVQALLIAPVMGVAHISLQILPSSSSQVVNHTNINFSLISSSYFVYFTWPRHIFQPLLFISHPPLTARGLASFRLYNCSKRGNFMVIANPLLLGPRLLKVNFTGNKVNMPQRPAAILCYEFN